MKQFFAVSSVLQLMNLCAAIDEGLVDEAEERILIVADTRVINEVGPSFADADFISPLVNRFDRRINWNEWIWPYHPNQWSPSRYDQPVVEKLAQAAWGFADCEVQLFVESLHSNPAIALATVFRRAKIFVHADGLMTYGPTRNRVAPHIAQRLTGLLYMDLIPGLDPVLLSEYEVPRISVSAEALRSQIEHVARGVELYGLAQDSESVMIVGQYLSDVHLFSLDEEIGLYQKMLAEAISRNPSKVYFKPHPAASASVNTILKHQADRSGVDFELIEAKIPVEVVASVIRPRHVTSCFSTGMVTVWRLFGATAHSVGTRSALEKFAPYENSNRVPVTVCDFLFTDGIEKAKSSFLQELVRTVSYCMRAQQYPHLRNEAITFLRIHGSSHSRYFKRRRLTKLDLPGRLPERTTAQSTVSIARRLTRRVLRSITKLGEK